MESGKSMGPGFLARNGGAMAPYASGMLLNTDTSSAKVGESHPVKQSESEQVTANPLQSFITLPVAR
jgi:hypothetical protein